MSTLEQIIILVLSFFGIIAIAALITFGGSYLYIKSKRRIRKKYHYTEPAKEEYRFAMDKEAADNERQGSNVDGSSALQSFKH